MNVPVVCLLTTRPYDCVTECYLFNSVVDTTDSRDTSKVHCAGVLRGLLFTGLSKQEPFSLQISCFLVGYLCYLIFQ